MIEFLNGDWRRGRVLAFALVMLTVGTLVAPTSARAHPHAWIDFTVELRFDAKGRIVAMRQTWLFDDFYSMFVIEGATALGQDGKPSQTALDELMAGNMKNLAEYGYFTKAASGETEISFDAATEMSTRLVDNRLEMVFTLPLSAPVRADGPAFRYAAYDPSYYVEMVHAKVPDAVTLAGAPAGCGVEIIEPNPDPEQIVLAASLGAEESGGDTLGRFFAQEVRVTCG